MNCAWNYELSHAHLKRSSIMDGAWLFSPQLTMENVWDGFVILLLLNDCQSQGVRLCVPLKIEQKYCVTLVLEEHNTHMVTEGLQELPYYCDLCMCTYDDNDDNNTHKIQAIVTDSLSISHLCCGIFHCTEPLANNRHHFYPIHHSLHLICAINDCSQPVAADATGKPTKTYQNSTHQEMEKLNNEAANALHQQRACTKLPNIVPEDSMPVLPIVNSVESFSADGKALLDDVDEWYTINTTTNQVSCHQAISTSIGEIDTSLSYLTPPISTQHHQCCNSKTRVVMGTNSRHSSATATHIMSSLLCAHAESSLGMQQCTELRQYLIFL
jgi:hypothetical protein